MADQGLRIYNSYICGNVILRWNCRIDVPSKVVCCSSYFEIMIVSGESRSKYLNWYSKHVFFNVRPKGSYMIWIIAQGAYLSLF